MTELPPLERPSSFPFRGAFRRGIVALVSRSSVRDQPMKSDQSNPAEPFPREKIPLEILEWARQTLDEGEDFIAELEARARSK
jgi:hypothetical protein